MSKYIKLQNEYNQLDNKYSDLLAEKSKIEYELTIMKNETSNILEQEQEVRHLNENIRKLKHDIKNHMMVIASYLNSEDYNSARDYTSEILDKLNSVHSYIETGNTLLNHIINQKFKLAKSKGISVKAEIENLSFARMKSLDFSAILSNLLDNAIEASEKEEKSQIIVFIVKKRCYETIVVKNYISQSVLENNSSLTSSKKEKTSHGMGVNQIKSLVEKYNGLYEFYEEDGFFCAGIMIEEM